MIAATALLALAMFVLALSLSGLARIASGAISAARQAIDVMRDPASDDLAKERASQAASLQLLGIATSALLRGSAVLASSALPIVMSDVAGLAPAGEVIGWTMRPDVLFATTLSMIAMLVARRLSWSRT